jgi:hypothetical protein
MDLFRHCYRFPRETEEVQNSLLTPRSVLSALQLIGTLLAATVIGYPNAAGAAAPGVSLDQTLRDCSAAAHAQPILKGPRRDAVTTIEQDEAVVGLAFLSEMKGLVFGLMDPVPRETSTPPILSGFVSCREQDSLMLPKQEKGAESLRPGSWGVSIEVAADPSVQFDADEAPAQNPERQKHPANPRAFVIERPKGIHWVSLISQWWLVICFQQTERVVMEAKTRSQLKGKFFHEWFSDVAQYRYGLWNDGDKFFTSYLGHPLQGAVMEGIFWQNNDRVRFTEQDFHSAAYRKALLQAFAFAAVDAVQWKLGPVSEASIGHVGLPPHWWDTAYFCNLSHAYCHPRTGLNDLVMDEVGGTALTIGFQWMDKHFQKPLENRIRSKILIDTMRIFTNPPQSLANFSRFRTPWYRDDRDR